MSVDRAKLILKFVLLALLGVIPLITTDIHYGGGDPYYGPIDAQSILENGTILLDDYIESGRIHIGYQLRKTRDGRFYNKYPDGTSILQIPFVAIAHYIFKMDMTERRHNYRFQKIMAGIIFILIFLIFYRISRLYFDERKSLLISFMFIWGTSMVGSNLASLWTHLMLMLLSTLVIYMLLIYEKRATIKPYILGTILFLTFFVRQTGVFLVISVFIYLFLKRDFRVFFKTVLVSFIFFLLYMVYNYLVYKTPFSLYDTWGLRFHNYGLRNLYCLLTSPTRGLFVFNPVLLITAAGVFLYWKEFPKHFRYLLMLWITGIILMVSYFWTAWWGGWAYGPRLLVEIFPGLFVLTLWVLKRNPNLFRYFLLLSIAGLFINFVNSVKNKYAHDINRIVYTLYSPGDYSKIEWFYCSWEANQILASPYTNRVLERRVEMFKDR